ncbi:MAG TPA: N-acetylglucosamine-6-phosphate deacetylase, partial [Halieaceae bacterium]|nr:N-acetylglucosamine-6-phosphate deacetylase [Halieaceae bacterium]
MGTATADRAISAPRLFDGEKWHDDSALLLAGEHVAGVLPRASLPSTLPCETLRKGTLAPGFVDLQANGGGGLLFNNAPTVETVLHMTASHRRCG